MGDSNFLVKDSITAFRTTLKEVLHKPYTEISAMRRIGTLNKVLYQLKLVELCVKLAPKDSRDVWKYAGNESPEELAEMDFDAFMKSARRLEIHGRER
jgi:malonate decarboxylase beta subunit